MYQFSRHCPTSHLNISRTGTLVRPNTFNYGFREILHIALYSYVRRFNDLLFCDPTFYCIMMNEEVDQDRISIEHVRTESIRATTRPIS
jgi:hypothetical protein